MSVNNITFEQWKEVKNTDTDNPQSPSSNSENNATNEDNPQNNTSPSPMTKLKQETTLNNEQKTLSQDTIIKISTLDSTRGFKNTEIEFKGELYGLGQRSGVIISPSTELILKPLPLYHRFKTEPSNPNFKDTSIYTNKLDNINFSSDTDLNGDVQFGRIHSPTFYFKFLLEKNTQFPLLFFTRGDIRQSNSIAILFHHDTQLSNATSLNANTNSTFFRAIVFFTDNKNKMYNFETDYIFQTNKIQSLSLTIFQFFGNFSQLVLSFDDGTYFKSSSLIGNAIMNNNFESSKIFPKDLDILKILKAELSIKSTNATDTPESLESITSPGVGSIMFRFSILNSGTGLLSNLIFGNSPDYLQNCLSTCPINYSYQLSPLLISNDTHLSNDINLKKQGYQSETCLSCTSLNKNFNLSSNTQSLYPIKPNWNFSSSQELKSNDLINRFNANI